MSLFVGYLLWKCLLPNIKVLLNSCILRETSLSVIPLGVFYQSAVRENEKC